MANNINVSTIDKYQTYAHPHAYKLFHVTRSPSRVDTHGQLLVTCHTSKWDHNSIFTMHKCMELLKR